MISLRRLFTFLFFFNKNEYVSTSFIASRIGTSFMAQKILFTSASLIFSPHDSFLSRNFSLVTLITSLFLCFYNQIFFNPSLFIIHILCNIIHIAKISSIFLNGTSDYVINSLRLSFSIPNSFSTHVPVEDCMKFQFASFLENAVIPPLNEQYIHGLTEYAASPTNL